LSVSSPSVSQFFPAAATAASPHLTIGSKFFTEQVILAEFLAQHIEARTGIHVDRKSNLGGTLLCQKALLSGDLDLYVEYTGTAPDRRSKRSSRPGSTRRLRPREAGLCPAFQSRSHRASRLRKHLRHGRSREDAQRLHLRNTSDIAPFAPKMRAGFGYEFLERPDGFRGWSQLYGLHFAARPASWDLGLIYRALVDKKSRTSSPAIPPTASSRSST